MFLMLLHPQRKLVKKQRLMLRKQQKTMLLPVLIKLKKLSMNM
jgi:hypothetical protein